MEAGSETPVGEVRQQLARELSLSVEGSGIIASSFMMCEIRQRYRLVRPTAVATW